MARRTPIAMPALAPGEVPLELPDDEDAPSSDVEEVPAVPVEVAVGFVLASGEESADVLVAELSAAPFVFVAVPVRSACAAFVLDWAYVVATPAVLTMSNVPPTTKFAIESSSRNIR